MKQTAVEWLEIVLIPDPISEEDFEHNINCWKQAKEIEKYVAQQYAEFAIECYRKELPVLEFDGWINHLRH